MQEKILELEKNQNDLSSRLHSVENAVTPLIQKVDKLVDSLNENSRHMAVVTTQMTERHQFESRIGNRVDKIEKLGQDTFNELSTYRTTIKNVDKLYSRVITGAFIMLVTCGGIIY